MRIEIVKAKPIVYGNHLLSPCDLPKISAEAAWSLARKMSIIAINLNFKLERAQTTGTNAEGLVILYKTFPNQN